jgi:hypothetical protein
MNSRLKTIAVNVGTATALVGALAWAQAAPPALAAPARQACAELEASDIAWVTLTEDFDIDEQVDFYPSGTELITPVFEYECVPSRVSVTTIYSLDGEVVFSDKESLRATSRSGLYSYPLATTDDEPLPDGLWRVEYFDGQTLLTSGEVVVGDPSSDAIDVEGSVKDKKSRRDISGATILVLEPGVTAEAWVEGGQDDEEVLTAGQSDSQGEFTLASQLTRNATYSLIVVARGYKPIATDSFVIDDEVEAPAQLNILMSK